MSDFDESLTKYDNEHFIREIRSAIYRGYGFVPLLGAGISAASGIPTGEQFTDYLAWATYLCVSAPNERGDTKYWDLKRDGWPQAQIDTSAAKKWIYLEFLKTARLASMDVRPDDPRIIHPVEVPASSPASRAAQPKKRKAKTKASSAFSESLGHTAHRSNSPLIPEAIATEIGKQYNAGILRDRRHIHDLGEGRTDSTGPVLAGR